MSLRRISLLLVLAGPLVAGEDALAPCPGASYATLPWAPSDTYLDLGARRPEISEGYRRAPHAWERETSRGPLVPNETLYRDCARHLP